jgi:hypothetical protein
MILQAPDFKEQQNSQNPYLTLYNILLQGIKKPGNP